MFLLRQLVVGITVQTLIVGGALFLPAATWHWARAWIMLAIFAIASGVSILVVFPGREDLLRERMKPWVQEGQLRADRVAVLLFLFFYIVSILVIPLDVFRYHWLPQPSMWISGLGLLLFVIGCIVITLVFKENPFAAPVVKYQRNQKVVDTGVYRVVRHPMYSGFALLAIGMALWLESFLGAIASLIPIAILAVRSSIEEQFLKETLPGYPAYTQQVPYRLIPFVW
jgi:protein-S-isoprenylcysteine O-methyltransferase Ste14